jgi:hypothetical protein
MYGMKLWKTLTNPIRQKYDGPVPLLKNITAANE